MEALGAAGGQAWSTRTRSSQLEPGASSHPVRWLLLLSQPAVTPSPPHPAVVRCPRIASRPHPHSSQGGVRPSQLLGERHSRLVGPPHQVSTAKPWGAGPASLLLCGPQLVPCPLRASVSPLKSEGKQWQRSVGLLRPSEEAVFVKISSEPEPGARGASVAGRP